MIWVVTLDLPRTVQRYGGQKVLRCVISSVLRLADVGYYSKGGLEPKPVSTRTFWIALLEMYIPFSYNLGPHQYVLRQ